LASPLLPGPLTAGLRQPPIRIPPLLDFLVHSCCVVSFLPRIFSQSRVDLPAAPRIGSSSIRFFFFFSHQALSFPLIRLLGDFFQGLFFLILAMRCIPIRPPFLCPQTYRCLFRPPPFALASRHVSVRSFLKESFSFGSPLLSS